MKIDWQKIKNLEVETKSGITLGKVKNIIFQTEGQTISQYEVGNLLSKKYLINREQVISIDDQKIIVDDNVDSETTSEESGGSLPDPEGVMMRETE